MSINIFRIFGLSGTILAILGILYSALRYRGRDGERFSLLNHFISELGEKGISSAAWDFNCGLIFSGLLLVPTIIDLGVLLHSPLGWLGAVVGTLAALAVSAVGLFPMNDMHSHGIAAMTYFRSGLVMVAFFGLAIQFQPIGSEAIARSANWLSLVSFLAYAAFLVRMTPRPRKNAAEEPLDPEVEAERPRVWLPPILEWAVFFSTILWLFGMTFFI